MALSKLRESQFVLYKMDIIIVVTSKVCCRIKSVNIYKGHRMVPEKQKQLNKVVIIDQQLDKSN